MFQRKKTLTRKRQKSAPKQVLLSFFLVIVSGAILLSLPISNKKEAVDFIDYFFISTSATCVTGLVPLVPADQFTFFGELVLLFLMQIGGLGFLTFLILFVSSFQQKISMTNKGVVTESLNLDSSTDVKKVLGNILKYTFVIEGIGFILLSIQFISEFGVIDGLWKGLFTSVSAFCNAGFDIIGGNSLGNYVTNPLVNLTVCALIILGGIGFTVWFDVERKLKRVKHHELTFHRFFHSLTLHTKLVIIFTTFLLVGGTCMILFLEYFNPQTLGPYNFFEKILISFFSSTSLRTAGFATIDFASLSRVTQFIMCGMMFIGGSPGGTAGGVKTTTFLLLLLTLVSNLYGDAHVSSLKKNINKDLILKASTIVLASFMLLMVCLCVLLATQTHLTFMELLFEAVSALATVGLSLNVTSSLTFIGKVVIIILMYCGRVGIMTLVVFFMNKKANYITNEITYPSESVLIG